MYFTNLLKQEQEGASPWELQTILKHQSEAHPMRFRTTYPLNQMGGYLIKRD